MAGEYPCENAMLLAHLDLNDLDADAGSGNWGWVDPETGREYVLMGVSNGTVFVDITDPINPVNLGKLPTQTVASVWREMKVLHHYALIVSEADGHGMQVYDMTQLRDIDPAQAPVTLEPTVVYGPEVGIGQSHNVAANPETHTAFIVGSRAPRGCAGGIHMVDMRNPLDPSYAGCFAEDGYTHDLVCLTYDGPDTRYAGRELCIASNEDVVTIVDVTERTAPAIVGQVIYPNIGYTHQGWFTEDMRHFIVNDELDEMRYGFNTRTLVFDFQDLEEPSYLGDHRGPTRAVAHNLYIRGDMIYMANYRRGLEIARIVDAETATLENVAVFDTYPRDDDPQFAGAWNNYPYYPSGTVAISDINRGLFLVRPYHTEPLALAAMRAYPGASRTLVEWTVEGDLPERFIVEHQTEDGPRDLGYVRASGDRMTYRLSVELPTGEHEIRLRGVAHDGMAVYGESIRVTIGSDAVAGR